MANQLYPLGYIRIHNQSMDFLTATIQAIPLLATYTYSATHEFVSDVVASEVAGTTRQTVTGKSITDSGTGILYNCANQVFPTPTSGQSIGWVALYEFITNDAGSRLLYLMDPTNITSNGEDVTNNINASGLFQANY